MCVAFAYRESRVKQSQQSKCKQTQMIPAVPHTHTSLPNTLPSPCSHPPPPTSPSAVCPSSIIHPSLPPPSPNSPPLLPRQRRSTLIRRVYCRFGAVDYRPRNRCGSSIKHSDAIGWKEGQGRGGEGAGGEGRKKGKKRYIYLYTCKVCVYVKERREREEVIQRVRERE